MHLITQHGYDVAYPEEAKGDRLSKFLQDNFNGVPDIGFVRRS